MMASLQMGYRDSTTYLPILKLGISPKSQTLIQWIKIWVCGTLKLNKVTEATLSKSSESWSSVSEGVFCPEILVQCFV